MFESPHEPGSSSPQPALLAGVRSARIVTLSRKESAVRWFQA